LCGLSCTKDTRFDRCGLRPRRPIPRTNDQEGQRTKGAAIPKRFPHTPALVRHLATGSVSFLLVVSAASYAAAPASEALAAVVATIAVKPGHQMIEGKVQGGTVTVRLVKTEHGREVSVSSVKVGSGGHFRVSVGAGTYKLILSRGKKQVVENLKVHSGKSQFVVVTVSQSEGLVGIAPVVFNY
jgi:hypothetical protein